MLTKRPLTAAEIFTIKTNIKEIEKQLGHPIPNGLIDASWFKGRVLRPGEVVNLCNNIKQFEEKSYCRHNERPGFGKDFMISFMILIVVGTILLIVEKIFNIKIL